MNVYDILKERGLIAQVTHEEEVRELLGKEKVTFYTAIGWLVAEMEDRMTRHVIQAVPLLCVCAVIQDTFQD